jgi:hypothetical protein
MAVDGGPRRDGRSGAWNSTSSPSWGSPSSLGWLAAYAVVVACAGDILRRLGIRRAIEALTGLALLALGARLAFERR